MLVPLSWLKDYVDIDVTPDELEERLFSCGFEVEEKHELGHDVQNVVVGLVKSCEAVEGTHLHKCMVDTGKHGVFQIMCGADNVHAGGKFPVALVGATVYGTAKDHKTIEGVVTIREGKLRGFDSFGMLCSGTELGITEDMYEGAGYNGLLVLPEDAVPGEDVKPIVGLDDWIFDVSITANRPDCQCIFGLAREVAASLGKPLRAPALDHSAGGSEAALKVTVEAPDLCPRYIGHYVSDVVIGPAPQWMRRRLALVGINAISNIVDITNYVLMELGQPMHAFDYSYLEGAEIRVRRAKEGEKITTLDEKEFTLTPDNLVICDAAKPVALAGIMGGLNSEIQDSTASVVYEAAKFMRDNVRKSSRALGQSSDSSAMFSKGVYEYSTVMAMERALHLTEELGAGKASAVHLDINTGKSLEPREMKVSLQKVMGVLGITVPEAEVLRIFTNLDFAPELSGDTLTVKIPAYREDIEGYQDLSEELIRMYGYDHVVPTFLPTAQVTMGGRDERQEALLRIKRNLAASGAAECVHYSFFSPADLELLRLPENAPERKAIPILNPINVDLSLMRTTLAPEMIRSMARNEKRGTLTGRLFEVGKVFLPKALPLTEYPEERDMLSIGVFGREEDFFTLKGLTERVAECLQTEFRYKPADKPFLHPNMTAAIIAEGRTVGYMGKLRYEIAAELDMEMPAYVAEIDLAALSGCFGRVGSYTPLPKFDVEKRDFAFVVDSRRTCEEIEDAIRASCPYITSVELFDVYEGLQVGAGRKSMAFSVVFTPTDHAFTDAEIESFVQKILDDLQEKAGAVLRG